MKYYTEDHQWVEIVGDEAVVGLSEYAVEPGTEVAEIELPEPESPFPRPAWLGEEISGDPRYTNGALSVKPFGTWRKML